LLSCGFPVLPSRNLITENISLFLSPLAYYNFGKLSKRYGPVFGAMQGGVPTIVTSDADVIRSISQLHFDCFHAKIPVPLDPDPVSDENVHMFASRGARWKRMRSITSEAMSTKNMKRLFPIVEESVFSFMRHLESLPMERAIEAHRLFQNHTSDVLARCAFGQNQSLHSDNLYHNIFSQAFGNKLEGSTLSWDTISLCFPLLSSILRRLKKYTGTISLRLYGSMSPMLLFSNHLAQLRNDRRAHDAKYDFLQFFKDVEDSSFDGYSTEHVAGRVDVSTVRINKAMAPGETIAQCRFIAVAGFDTTANTLALACDLLARNQRKQELLLEEIDAVGTFTYDSIQSMKYLHNCIFETLRLYPHATPLQHRLCMETCHIGPYTFQKGACIVVDQWALHHNPAVWGDDVEEFRPERFELLTNNQLRAFMPFGLGPRQCVGMRFALMEMKLTLCILLSKYKLRRKTDENEVPRVRFYLEGILEI
uniref:Cytochrome P450 n=1 Tax=Heligmosomoides polygyrus TaxID=6339 RepID=A0A183GFP1_HELPZ